MSENSVNCVCESSKWLFDLNPITVATEGSYNRLLVILIEVVDLDWVVLQEDLVEKFFSFHIANRQKVHSQSFCFHQDHTEKNERTWSWNADIITHDMIIDENQGNLQTDMQSWTHAGRNQGHLKNIDLFLTPQVSLRRNPQKRTPRPATQSKK